MSRGSASRDTVTVRRAAMFHEDKQVVGPSAVLLPHRKLSIKFHLNHLRMTFPLCVMRLAASRSVSRTRTARSLMGKPAAQWAETSAAGRNEEVKQFISSLRSVASHSLIGRRHRGDATCPADLGRGRSPGWLHAVCRGSDKPPGNEAARKARD